MSNTTAAHVFAQRSQSITDHSISDPDNEPLYSPPMSAAMLPGAPQSLELMLLTSYITSTFTQAGTNLQRPTDAEKFSMQDVLLTSTSDRADFRAAFLHAVHIACKALHGFAAAKAEVAAELDAAGAGPVEMEREYLGMRTNLTNSSIGWEDIIGELAQAMTVGQQHLAIIQAFCTVAECRICIRECFVRLGGVRAARELKANTEANMKMGAEMGVEMEGFEGEASEAGEDVGSVRGEGGGSQRGGQGGKDDDRMEVDSAYSP